MISLSVLVQKGWRWLVALQHSRMRHAELKMMDDAQTSPIPTSSRRFWVWLLVLFAIVIGLTMWKDWWLTGEEPDILFYLVVPPVSMLGAVLCMFWVVKVRQLPLTFLDLLAIILGVNLVMQGLEIILRVIYYRLWEYPGWLYPVIVIPAGFLLGMYGLVRWGRVKPGMAAVLMAVGLAGELVSAGVGIQYFRFEHPGVVRLSQTSEVFKEQMTEHRSEIIRKYRHVAHLPDGLFAFTFPLRRLAIQRLALKPGERVLDMGCGAGELSPACRGGWGSG